VYGSVLQCVAVCCNVLQCAAVCYSVLLCLLRLRHLVCVAVAADGAYRSSLQGHCPQMIHELLGSFVVCAVENAPYAVNVSCFCE